MDIFHVFTGTVDAVLLGVLSLLHCGQKKTQSKDQIE